MVKRRVEPIVIESPWSAPVACVPGQARPACLLVPAGVRQLRRDGVVYRDLDEDSATSPIIMSHRRDDTSAEIGVILELIRDIYREEGIAFGE